MARKLGCQKRGIGRAILKASAGVMALAGPMLQNSPLAIQARQFQQAVPVTKQRVNIPVYKDPKEEEKKKEKAQSLKKGGMPSRSKKYFRKTESGAGMTQAGVKAYRRMNPGSKLSTAVTEDKPGKKRAGRRKSYCARSAGQMKMFPKAANDPNSRLRQARRRWKCR
jgi:hypothetical protein